MPLSSPVRSSIRLPGPYAAVVMDLDGLLVQTEQLWAEAKAVLFGRHGTEYRDDDHRAVFGTSDVYTATYLTHRFGLPESEMPAIREEYMTIAGRLFLEGVEACTGATDLVAHLSGRVPLGLATNTHRPQALTILRSTPFADRFDAIVTGDEGHPKPAPDLYLAACLQLGVEPARAVALEDSPTGVAAAKSAGLTCIGVPSHPDEPLRDADLVVGSLVELL